MNEQEIFWQGMFGDEYIGRNISDQLLSSNIKLFSDVFSATKTLDSILELGANVGMNIRAIKALLPAAQIDAVEINPKAHAILTDTGLCRNASLCSISEFNPERTYDLSFTKTVLIHLNDDDLLTAYETLYKSSRNYILVAEYYSPYKECVEYRGHSNKLFKRDFCKELMTHYPKLKLIDYDFIYRGDPVFPQDDISWFLMQKAT